MTLDVSKPSMWNYHPLHKPIEYCLFGRVKVTAEFYEFCEREQASIHSWTLTGTLCVIKGYRWTTMPNGVKDCYYVKQYSLMCHLLHNNPTITQFVEFVEKQVARNNHLHRTSKELALYKSTKRYTNKAFIVGSPNKHTLQELMNVGKTKLSPKRGDQCYRVLIATSFRHGPHPPKCLRKSLVVKTKHQAARVVKTLTSTMMQYMKKQVVLVDCCLLNVSKFNAQSVVLAASTCPLYSIPWDRVIFDQYTCFSHWYSMTYPLFTWHISWYLPPDLHLTLFSPTRPECMYMEWKDTIQSKNLWQ